MVSSVRYRPITNATNAAVVAGGANIGYGQDFSLETVARTMVAATDIGAGAGQTLHLEGMIFAEFTGAVVKDIVSIEIFRIANGFSYEFLGTDILTVNLGFKIVNAGGVSTLRLKDAASAAGARLIDADKVVVTVLLGSSNS